jgi:hypothetical protein
LAGVAGVATLTTALVGALVLFKTPVRLGGALVLFKTPVGLGGVAVLFKAPVGLAGVVDLFKTPVGLGGVAVLFKAPVGLGGVVVLEAEEAPAAFLSLAQALTCSAETIAHRLHYISVENYLPLHTWH